MAKVLPYGRRVAVLRLLLEHGPLSSRGLTACLSPTPGARALRYILKRLYDRKLLAHRFERVSGRSFHQLSHDPMAQLDIAALLGVDAEALSYPHVRYAELPHSEDCAIWCELLRAKFRELTIRREFCLPEDEEVKGLLLSRGEERDLLPDLLAMIPGQDGTSRVSFAVEIERTAKSGARLTRKLRKYAEQTRLDGLVYVCSSDSLIEKILHVYKAKVADRALRINHYAKNFILFAKALPSRVVGELPMFNSAGEAVSLEHWIRVLKDTSHGGRRDSAFQHHSPHRNDVFPLEDPTFHRQA